MTFVKRVFSGCRCLLLVAWVLTSLPVHAQFARSPLPLKTGVLQPSEALNAQAYRLDAARHIYGAYPSHILKGRVPALVYAIVVTETELDAVTSPIGVAGVVGKEPGVIAVAVAAQLMQQRA